MNNLIRVRSVRSSPGFTLIELAFGLLLGALAIGLAMQAWITLYKRAGMRTSRCQDMGRALLAGELISYDLERAFDSSEVTNSGSIDLRLVTEEQGRDTRASYGFDPGSRQLVRSDGNQNQKNLEPFGEVSFSTSVTLSGRRFVECRVVPLFEQEGGPGSTPALEPFSLRTARVLRSRSDPSGNGPNGVNNGDNGGQPAWNEPSWTVGATEESGAGGNEEGGEGQ